MEERVRPDWMKVALSQPTVIFLLNADILVVIME